MARLVLFLLLLLAIALALRVDPLFSVVWFLLGLYALARLWTRRAARDVQIRRRFVDHAFHGDQVKVDLAVRNNGRLPIPWLEISESVPLELKTASTPAQVVTLGPHKERHLRYVLSCRRRGYYRLGPTHAHTGDVLGIEERYLALPEPKHLTVYPRVVPLERLGLPTRSAVVTVPTPVPLFEDPARVVGVRDYRPGDSPRRIHWTATARIGRPMVKLYQPATARETLICLDLNLNSYPIRRFEATEQAIVVAASLANHMAVQERMPVGLATEARDSMLQTSRRVALAPRPERTQLMSVLEVLARVEAVSEGRFVDLLRQESLNLSWGATLVAITGHIDDTLAETMLYLKKSGYAVSAILVRPDALRPEDAGRIELGGVPVYRVWTDREMVALQ